MSCDICVCRNNQTGKYFIVIDSTQDTVITLVTPISTILPLKSILFSEPEDMDENSLREAGLLSEEQLSAYYRYIEEHEKELAESSTQTGFKHGGAEPEYIRTYRRLLGNPHSMPSTMHRIIEERGRIKWYELKAQLTKYGYLATGGSPAASLGVLKLDGYVQVEGTGDSKSISYGRAIERKVADKTSRKATNEFDKFCERNHITEEQKKILIKKLSELL
jgi:hypothetical protein